MRTPCAIQMALCSILSRADLSMRLSSELSCGHQSPTIMRHRKGPCCRTVYTQAALSVNDVGAPWALGVNGYVMASATSSYSGRQNYGPLLSTLNPRGHIIRDTKRAHSVESLSHEQPSHFLDLLAESIYSAYCHSQLYRALFS